MKWIQLVVSNVGEEEGYFFLFVLFCGFWLFKTVTIYCTLSIVKGLHLYSVVQAWNYSCCQHQHSVNRQCTKKSVKTIDHFWVPLCICFKTSLHAKHFIRKWLWFAWKWTLQAELIFIWMVPHLHVDLFWKALCNMTCFETQTHNIFSLGVH